MSRKDKEFEKKGKELYKHIMTKLIIVTGWSGTGKTTIASILAESISTEHTVCLIDDNLLSLNINIYSTTAPTENINLYTCLSDKESCRRAIMESAAKLKENLYFFSGDGGLLTEEKIDVLKERDIFEYIILDSGREINDELFDYNVKVVNPNNFQYKIASQSDYEASKDIIIVNRYTDNSEFKVKKQDFKLYFCPEIINFTNGYELSLPEENETEIKKIVAKITGKKTVNKLKSKFKLFGRSKHGI